MYQHYEKLIFLFIFFLFFFISLALWKTHDSSNFWIFILSFVIYTYALYHYKQLLTTSSHVCSVLKSSLLGLSSWLSSSISYTTYYNYSTSTNYYRYVPMGIITLNYPISIMFITRPIILLLLLHHYYYLNAHH